MRHILFLFLPLLLLALHSSSLAAEDSEECAADDETCSSAPRNTDQDDTVKLHSTHFYINGTWVNPISADTQLFAVIDPSTALEVTKISLATQDDVDAAVSAAKTALPEWRSTSLQQRRQHVERLLEIYNEHTEEMAQLISMEMGAPIDLARDAQAGSGEYHIEESLDALQYFEFERRVYGYDEEDEPTTTILMEPIGVVAMITPWNWPMNQVTLKVIPALLVG